MLGNDSNIMCNAYSSAIITGGGYYYSPQKIGNSSNYPYFSTIIGGNGNEIQGSCSSIIGGNGNTVNHARSVILGGYSTTSAANDTAYMRCAAVTHHLQVGGTVRHSSTAGRIDAENDIVAYSTSDNRLKENVKPIKNALCKLVEISGNTFDWKPLTEEEEKTIHGNKGRDVGVIAQEIEAILPEAVTTRDSGYKAVNYEKIIPLLIEAIKDQQSQIDELKKIIK